MTNPSKNTNSEISAEIAGIGFLSPRGDDLKDVARMELCFVREHIKGYSGNEQIFILDMLQGYILDILLNNDL